MTEIEKAFYDTLKTLEADYTKGLEALRQQSELREIAFSKAVHGLAAQVDSLSKQVTSLGTQSEQVSAQVGSLSTQVSTLARLLGK